MKDRRYRVIALHGFLGSASDWAPVAAACPDAQWEAADLWELFSDRRITDWPSIGAALAATLQRVTSGGALPTFLVAYSFGARVAFALPDLGTPGSPFAGACVVSCHPGLSEVDEGARTARRASDEAWAQKFLEAPVARIWKEWDAQPVFAGSAVPRRGPALPGPRVAIARAMRLASLGAQPDRRPLLRAWQQPLLWATGERDPKFLALAASLASERIPARFVTLERAGHRAPWDNTPAFARTLTQWIDEVLQAAGPRARPQPCPAAAGPTGGDGHPHA